MKRPIVKIQSLFLITGLILFSIVQAITTRAKSPPIPASLQGQSFAPEELDELLSPIALYPDPLLAQMLPAATFVDQIDEAVRTLGGKSDDNLIANQNWDISVKSIAHYPSIIQMMNQKRDWTTALGQAYVNQQADVEKSLQRLRAQAQEAGNLVSNEQQQVTTEQVQGQTVIQIEPAQPQVIYVPQYDPQVVYAAPSTGAVVASSIISFGAGLAMGAWMNRDWGWYGGGPYYHGWSGGGWVGASRGYANVNRSAYVNNSYRNVNVNQNIRNANTSGYRNNLKRDAANRQNRNNANAGRDRGRQSSFDSRNDALKNKDRAGNSLDQHRGRDTGAGQRGSGATNRGAQPATRDAQRGAQTANRGQDAQRTQAANRGQTAQRTQAGNRGQTAQRGGASPSARPATSGTNSAFGGSGNRQQATRDSNRGNQSLSSMNRGGGGGSRAASGGSRPSGGASRGGGGGASRGGGGGASRSSGGGASRGGGGGGRR